MPTTCGSGPVAAVVGRAWEESDEKPFPFHASHDIFMSISNLELIKVELDAEWDEVDVIHKFAPSAVHTHVKVVLSPEADLAILATKEMKLGVNGCYSRGGAFVIRRKKKFFFLMLDAQSSESQSTASRRYVSL